MTKDILIQYTHLQKERDDLIKRIDRLRKQSFMVSDIVQNS